MSIPVLPTTDVKFVAGTIGLFGAAPGAAYLAEFKTFNADPNVTMTALAGLVQKDAAKLAATVVANLGLTGAAATAGTAYLTGEFNANPTNHGKVVVDALLTLTTLTADATFGAAATAVTAMINKGAAYSAVATNTSKDLTVLKAAIAAGEANLDQIKENLASSEAQAAAALAKANAEATRLIKEASDAAAAIGEQKKQDAVAEAQSIIAKAKEATELERARVMAELKRDFGRLVIDTTSKVTGKTLGSDDHARLNQEALAQISL